MRAFIALLLVAAVSAKAPLLTNREPIPGKYIIKLKDGYDVDRVSALVDGKIGLKYRSALNGFAAELSDKALDFVRNLEGVEYVEQDGVMRTQYSWGIDRIDSRDLPLDDAYTPNYGVDGGSAYTAYVIDTGVLPTHEEFGGRAVQEVNFANGPNEDCNGHGTHCSGTVGGASYGVAPGVQVRGIRVLGCLGSGSTSGVIGGVDYVRENAPANSVASMSLGGGASAALDTAVNNLVASGVPTAVAAGNDNADACNSSPARAAQAISVGSTTSQDTRSSFSNWGTCVDIFAPGSAITSAWYTSDTATNTISGTSMACPHVAGALTLHGNEADLLSRATSGAITNVGTGSPNLFLYV